MVHGAQGRVAVDCVLGVDGVAHRCRTVASDNGAFTQAVLAWLTGPNPPRYAPALRDGIAVPELRRWVITFGVPDDPAPTVVGTN